jgi:hypothetical protein
MQEKKLTLFKIENELGEAEYQVSEQNIPNAEPLASYDDIGELYPNFYDTNSTYDMQAFTSNSLVNSFYATTPTRTVSNAARSLIGAANSVHQAGEGNSQFGTRWIHSLEEQQSKKIRATDEIPTGWLEGRKMKFNDEEK